MKIQAEIRLWFAVAILATVPVHPQNTRPQTTVDLRPLGAAVDLFTDQSNSRNPQRGVATTFWLGNDRIAVAFNTTPRWSSSDKPAPLHVRLLVFDRDGKQLSSREWDFGEEGSEGEATLELAPGPDNSILAIHESNAHGKIPEGDFIQVLNPDTSPRQDFYVSATSAWAAAILPGGNLVLETFFANKHGGLAWWSGQPLKPTVNLDLPPKTDDKQETLIGPGVAARADCPTIYLCSGIRVFGPGKIAWMYHTPNLDTVPVPLVFLNSTALLVELRNPDQKQTQLIVAHSDRAPAPLLSLPHGLEVISVAGVSADGQRVALEAGRQAGLCGGFDLWCKQAVEVLVLDTTAKRIVFEQGISPNGGMSALSPDGNQLAIFDRNKLAIYKLRLE